MDFTMLKIATQEQISNAILLPSFAYFCKQTKTPLPLKKHDDYFFNDLIDELAFIMAFKGFLSGKQFAFDNPQLLNYYSINRNVDNIHDACTNLYFLEIAKKSGLPIPLKVNNGYQFKDNLEEVSFKMFYTGWRGCLNIMSNSF